VTIDGLKSKVSDMAITRFVWDPVSDCVLQELDGSNNVLVVYTNEPQPYGGVLSQRRGSTTHILHADALGSTRALSDSSQTVTDTYVYDAWGNLVASSGSTVNPYRWVGRIGYYTDSSTGLVYVRARMYQPTVAGWLSRDPYTLADGINDFVYSYNCAVSYVDPSGTTSDSASHGTTVYYADIVATSFINGLPNIGTLHVPARSILWPVNRP